MKTTKLMIAGLVAALLAAPAAAAARKAAKTPDGSAVKVMLKKGLADMDRRDFTAAIAQFSKAAALAPDSRALFLLGYAHIQRGSQNAIPSPADVRDAREAVDAYAQARGLDPDLKVIADPSRFHRSLAWACETIQDFGRAAAAYRSAMAAAPRNPMIPLNLARVYSRLGEPAKAAESVSASLETARQIGQEELILKTLRGNPRFSSMLAYPDVAAVAGDAAPQVAIAQAAPARGEELRDAIADRPSLARSLAAAALPDPAVTSALASGDDSFKFRQYRGAINAYEEAARLDARRQTLSPVQRAILYERMGTAYNRLGLTQEAVTPLQMSLQAMPNNAAAHYQLALAYSVSGRFKEALGAIDATFQSAPSKGELRKYMILSRSDLELEPVRDMGIFSSLIERYEEKLARR